MKQGVRMEKSGIGSVKTINFPKLDIIVKHEIRPFNVSNFRLEMFLYVSFSMSVYIHLFFLIFSRSIRLFLLHHESILLLPHLVMRD